MGEEWIEDAKFFPDPFRHLETLTIPVKIIAAELGGKIETCERYREALKDKCEVAIISNAGHTFVEEGAIEQLTRETGDWLQKIL